MNRNKSQKLHSATTALQRDHHRTSSGNRAATPLVFVIVAVFALYFLMPIYWLLVSTTKNTGQLFASAMLLPPVHPNLIANLVWLDSHDGGVFWRWALNSVIYAGCTATLATLICASGGYALAKYRFSLRKPVLAMVVGALMIPPAALVIPIFLLVKFLGIMDTYAAVILPMLVNPFGVYFMSVYTGEAVAGELIDSGRVDGASDYGILFRIALPIMRPGLVTLFLILFIGTWNNFFLPLVLLNRTSLYPLPVGLQNWLSTISQAGMGPPIYPLVVVGSFLSILPMLILFPILRRHIVAGITLGSVKA